MIKVEQDYLKDIVMSICHKGNPFGKTGSTISGITGALTGGLLGTDPNRESKREARRQEEMTRKRIEEERLAREREEQFSKAVEQDKQTLQDAEGQRMARAKPNISTDFSKAIKGKKDDEDKLKKSLKKAFRG